MSLSFLRSPDLGDPGQVKPVVDGQYTAAWSIKCKTHNVAEAMFTNTCFAKRILFDKHKPIYVVLRKMFAITEELCYNNVIW